MKEKAHTPTIFNPLAVELVIPRELQPLLPAVATIKSDVGLLYYEESDHKPLGIEFDGHAFDDVGGNDWLLWHSLPSYA